MILLIVPTHPEVLHSCERVLARSLVHLNQNGEKKVSYETLTIMIPQQSMSNDSHIDGRRRLRKTFEGTFESGCYAMISLT